MKRAQHYDGIVIGAGHNGMITAAYMAKQGLKTLMLEKQVEVGGGLDTHEDDHHPGFYHNKHSVFHRVVTHLPWYKDLELEEIGLEYIDPEVGCAQMFTDGSSICWYKDVEATAKQLAQYSRKDAETYKKMVTEWAPLVHEIVTPETYNPAMRYEQKREILEKWSVGRQYLDIASMSPVEVAEKYFESDAIRAMMVYLCVMRGYEPWSPGIGYLIPVQVVTGVNPQLCKGSSHQLAHYLEDAVWKFGGEIRERSGVTNIIIQGGKAKGVELWDGTTIWADQFIASSLNPQQTFLELIGEPTVPKHIAEKAAGYKYSNLGPIFALNLALNERPIYIHEKGNPDVGRAFLQIMGCDSMADVKALDDACRAGNLPDKLFFNGTTPTVLDPTQAPPGKHTAFMWPLAPYALHGDPNNWDIERDQIFEAYMDKWRYFAPNLTDQNIVSKDSYTPLDVERHLHNMFTGDWMVGELNSEQCLDKRPFEEVGQCRGYFEGLYLCGSSSHPGGNITGAPGYNAAKAIGEDLGLDMWWHPHDVETMWRAKAGQ